MSRTKKFIIFFTLLVLSSHSKAQQCHEILASSYQQPQALAHQAQALFFQSASHSNTNIYTLMLAIMDHPNKLEILEEIGQRLSLLDPQTFENIPSYYLKPLLTLLEIQTFSAQQWLVFLTDSTKHEFLNYYSSLVAHMMVRLPQETKDFLLLKFGGLYTHPDHKRRVSSLIHILLNPKKMYDDMKALGGNDLEFYSAYLRTLKSKVFPSLNFGGYSTSLIKDIVQKMAVFLSNQDNQQAFVFFGSVPNGFAHANSDYDLFNHPTPRAYPKKNRYWQQHQGNPRVTDPFQELRYQIKDPKLQDQLSSVTQDSPWSSWHLKDDGERAHEHFGALTHIFSFHITKKEVSLRFYHNYIHYDEDGNVLDAWEYTSLSLDEN